MSALGYPIRVIDHEQSYQYRQSLSSFQRDNGLPETGALDIRTQGFLRKVKQQQVLSEKSKSNLTSESIDWAPFFKQLESGCADSDDAGDLINNLVTYMDDAVIDRSPPEIQETAHIPMIGKVVLPEKYRNHVGSPTRALNDESASFFLPTKNSNYYGVPLSKIEIVAGNRNGINAILLHFNSSLADAKQTLRSIQYKAYNQDDLYFKAKVEQNSDGEVFLVCDRST